MKVAEVWEEEVDGDEVVEQEDVLDIDDARETAVPKFAGSVLSELSSPGFLPLQYRQARPSREEASRRESTPGAGG